MHLVKTSFLDAECVQALALAAYNQASVLTLRATSLGLQAGEG